MVTKKQSKIRKLWNSLTKPFRSYVTKLKNKNWKADRQAWKNKWKLRLKTWKPYSIVIGWYTILLYLFVGWLSGNYSWQTVTFAFALYFVYEKLRDDYIEIQELKSIHKEKNDK